MKLLNVITATIQLQQIPDLKYIQQLSIQERGFTNVMYVPIPLRSLDISYTINEFTQERNLTSAIYVITAPDYDRV